MKKWYSQSGDAVEVPVDGFVIDLVRDDLLIEIQTRGFSGIKRKLRTLLDLGHSVRIVHPIAVEKWIVKLDDSGEEISRRRSPKRGAPADVFSELVSFPRWVAEVGLEIEIVLTHEEEVRAHQPGKAWRRKGWVVIERRLLGVVDGTAINSTADLLAFLPDQLPDEFTTADLAEATGRPRRIAQQMAYCLREADVIAIAGKRGNALIYRVA
ncbi:MAG: hypothetical protein HKN91_02585 [Acidimicrobiia bacterium]|nr:hypothetical protein [Acidimicrobiia bacterium]